MELTWRWYAWAQLPPDVLYAFLKLRSDIFVVEQNCVFPEMDGIDDRCEHLCGFAPDGTLVAYLRLVPPGVKAPQPAIGRLVVRADARKAGHARAGMQRAIARCRERWPGQAIFLSAQQHLERYYASMGFRATSAPYLEDGIWHVNMVL